MPKNTGDQTRLTFLQQDTEFIERGARYLMLDAIACEMHNEGHNLDGNTAESDTRWFARRLYDRQKKTLTDAHWDNLAEEQKQYWLRLSAEAIELIPDLMGRMSARCIRIAQATRTIIEAEKLNKHYEEEKGIIKKYV